MFGRTHRGFLVSCDECSNEVEIPTHNFEAVCDHMRDRGWKIDPKGGDVVDVVCACCMDGVQLHKQLHGRRGVAFLTSMLAILMAACALSKPSKASIQAYWVRPPDPVQTVCSAPAAAPMQNSEYQPIGVPEGSDDWWVCAMELPVKGAPGEQWDTLYTLHYGDHVGIHDRSKGVQGWAMIEVARWVWEQGLCPE